MPQLSVNIDHVATIRQARYRGGAEWGEPDVVRIVSDVELAGADGITVHLREDRRHITDRDVELLRPLVRVKFNLEMAATDEMVSIASRIRPHSAMLVPEGRNEVTTEGGLDVAGQQTRLRDIVARLRAAGCLVSAFIDADERQIAAAAGLGFDVCEIHTGPYAHRFLACGGEMLDARLATELGKVRSAGEQIIAAGMRFNAGHALNYSNVGAIAGLTGLCELHIGHSIVARAIHTGIGRAVQEMKAAIAAGSGTSREN
ncbi:MAG: pyridoxine 5'-phosphate synthase [Planctomycetota bacterium]|nr:pyridoxine 5'-phosphate synthase [Planctomycetota bacterium]